MPTVAYSGSEPALLGLMQSLPAILTGRVPDPWGVARSMQLRLGVALLSKIQQDFIRKARGGTGEDGIKWRPLTRSTIAQRRITTAERKAAGIAGRRERGLLTPAQNRRWKQIFASRRATLILRGMSPGDASARAAAIAWTVLKSEGAQTRLGLFGGRQVEIGRDTGRMFRSLSPGVEDRPSGAAEQRFDVATPGRVIVGSSVRYFGRFHATRPVWPPDGRLPAAWWTYLLGVWARGLGKVLALLLASGRVR